MGQEPIVEEDSDGKTFVRNVTKTTRTRVVRRVIIGPDGEEHITEHVVEDPEGLTIALAEESGEKIQDIPETESNTENPMLAFEQKKQEKEESWRPIPIIRLDQ